MATAKKTAAAKKVATKRAVPPVAPETPSAPAAPLDPAAGTAGVLPPVIDVVIITNDPEPGDAPDLEPDVVDEPPAPHPGVSSLADARALRELDPNSAEVQGAAAYEAPNERAITAFVDADGRTMLVGYTYGSLFKTPRQ